MSGVSWCTLRAVKKKTLKIPTLSCAICGGEWIPRKQEWPLRCAKCKSPYWNKPRAE